MFSATMPSGVMRLADQFLRNPLKVSIAVSRPAERVTQGVYRLGHDQKLNLMNALLNSDERKDYRVIVFCSRKSAVAALYRKLREKQSSVGRISSELEQEERESVMLKFRNGEIRILVATDVISRGIDIDGIDLVVNFDVPRDPEDYVHRIGRTARAQRSGEAITLIAADEERGFARIEKLIERDLPDGVSKGNYAMPTTNDARSKSAHRRKSFHRKGKPGGSATQ
jgi:superfamily II DNA/RNA helicase